MVRLHLAVLGLSFAVLSTGPVEHGRPVAKLGCEPGGPVELRAQVVSIQQDHGVASVVVAITVSSTMDLSSLDLLGRLQPAGVGPSCDFDVPIGVVSRGYERTAWHLLRMEDGRDHGLLLTLHARPYAGLPVSVTTWLPVSLDPARRPRDAGHVLEYRAQTGSGDAL